MAMEIEERLFALQDKGYRDFHKKLVPTVPQDKIIGVRTPALRKLAKEIVQMGEAEAFLARLPHRYFDENQLHAFIISGLKDYGECMAHLQEFLPYIDNWATCDQLSPKVFKQHRQELLKEIRKWLESEETYTVRFAIGMLMHNFLDEDFDEAYLSMVAEVRSEEYYVNMMIAWYFATALAKQYDAVIPYLEEHRLSRWCHNKTIQKAIESHRISDGHKAYLRALRIQ